MSGWLTIPLRTCNALMLIWYGPKVNMTEFEAADLGENWLSLPKLNQSMS